MDYNLINDLNSQINRLRAENEQLRQRPESCPECPEVEPTVVSEAVYVPNVVFFRINLVHDRCKTTDQCTQHGRIPES